LEASVYWTIFCSFKIWLKTGWLDEGAMMSDLWNPNAQVSTPKKRDEKIGQILIRLKFVTSDRVAVALIEQKKVNAESKRRFKLGEILLFLQVINTQQLHLALRHQQQKAEEGLQEIKEIKRQKAAYARKMLERQKAAEKGSAWKKVRGLLSI
jgi:hypothetical protein